jgi:hypothetical protein
VISITTELGVAIITLGRIYFVLSWWLAPTDVMPVLYRRRVSVRPQVI